MTSVRRSKRASSKANPALLAGLCAITLASVFLLYSAGKMLPASINYFQSSLFLADWAKQKQQPNAQAFAIAHQAALKSATLFPVANGRYYTQLGHVLQWQDFAKNFGDPVANDSRSAALEAHRKAVQARPTWPNSYIDLAWTKLYLMHIDQEFEQALAHAEHYGRSRLFVNRHIAEISLFAWPHLTTEQRVRALKAAKRTVMLSPREGLVLQNAAKATGLTDELCQAVPQEMWGTHLVCTEKDV